MNSNEIEHLLKKKQYLLSVKEFISMLWTSPQIRGIKTNEDGSYTIETDEQYNFNFKVELEEKENKKGKTI